ncbi:MAG: HRDC domain-containing protein [Sphaerochaetaceae bacterium]
MYEYTLIKSDQQLQQYLQLWNKEDITSFAIDFEGEFNLHIYGEHLCLIQMFDSRAFYLIDPLSVSVSLLKEFFEDEHIEKIMFDASSDASLLYKNYKILMKGVYDVHLIAKCAGIEGNLSSLIARVTGQKAVKGKKSNQRANWLKRPIGEKLVEYALGDVAHLFAVKEYLVKEIAGQNKEVEAQKIIDGGVKVRKHSVPGWTKLPGYRKMNRDQKIYLRWLFESRDMLAQEKNLPPYRILDKRLLTDLAKNPPISPEELFEKVTHPDRSIESTLRSLLVVALEGAKKEISER